MMSIFIFCYVVKRLGQFYSKLSIICEAIHTLYPFFQFYAGNVATQTLTSFGFLSFTNKRARAHCFRFYVRGFPFKKLTLKVGTFSASFFKVENHIVYFYVIYGEKSFWSNHIGSTRHNFICSIRSTHI